MKTIGLLTIVAFFGVLMSMQYNSDNQTSTESESTGISFKDNTTWATILQKAKEEDKLIFVDVYASWCGPCKQLKKNTFSDASVGELFNKEFINAAYDAEQGAGLEVAQKFGVNSYPTLIFISPEGNVIKKVVGYHTSDELIKLGREIITKNKNK